MIRDRWFSRGKKKNLVDNSSTHNSSSYETRNKAHSDENEDLGRTNDSAAIQMEMPTYPPPTYSAASEMYVVRECTEQDSISAMQDVVQKREAPVASNV